MTYLLWQLFGCLFGTAILFLALGWFLRGRYWSTPTDTLVTGAERASWQTSLDSLKGRVEAEAARRVAAEKAFDDAQSQSAKISSLLDRHTAEIRCLAEELADKNQALVEGTTLIAELQAEAARMLAGFAAISQENGKLSMQLTELAPKLAVAATAGTEIGVLRARIADLEPRASQFQTNEAELTTLRSRIAELEPQVAGRDTKLLAIADELAMLKRGWLEREGKFHALKEESTILKTQLAEYELKLGQPIESNGDLTKLRGRIAELEPQIAEQESQIKAWETRYVTAVGEKEAALSECRGRVAELAGQLSNRHAKMPIQQLLPTNDRDDLKKIYGIGPVLEKKLNDLGVYFFREIAVWTEEDIQRYEGQLKEFRQRIERDQWIGSAREEHFKKYGEEVFKASSAGAS